MIAALQEAASRKSALAPAALGGLVIEVRDIEETRAFYECIFGGSAGQWQGSAGTLAYRRGRQRVEFVQRAKLRPLSHTGHHQGYVVAPARLAPLARELAGSGCHVDRWREDHPKEREVGTYVLDPSGNRVQLVPDGGAGLLLDHVAIEVHDLELAEICYVNILGGMVDCCHGWAMEDYAQAFAWGKGEDPCAPWTRRYDVRYWDKVRIARPNMQLFVRFGPMLLALILATEHRQEPPPEQLTGTPRLIVVMKEPASRVAAELSRARLGYEQVGSTLFMRDLSGNFVQLDCL